MYQVSRCIYRELAPDIIEDRLGEDAGNHERVLRACEAAVHRLATDWHYFAKPSKTLFNDIRIYFPMSAQYRVYKVVDRYMTFAKEYFSTRPLTGYDVEGNRLECRATTRRGTAVPAHAAAAQRLLPVAPAPRRDRRGQARRRVGTVAPPCDQGGDPWRRNASASSGWASWARAWRRISAARASS